VATQSKTLRASFRISNWIRVGAAAVVLATSFGVATTASAARTVRSLPLVENFDAGTYASDLVWTSQGATHTWMSSAGWRGGAAKFTPPTGGEGYSGLGQFLLSGLSTVPEQINVRFLIYHGSTWMENSNGSKLVILNRSGNSGRPMIITSHWPGTDPQWETIGACDGTTCRYDEGDFWPRGGDRLKVGNPPLAREREWICVEFEANTRTGMIRLYVNTQDGDLQDLYIQRPMDVSGAGGVWSHIDIIGGYMARTAQANADNYFMIDELVVDSRRIGPPQGFGSGTRPQSPTSLSVQ
jgi:hypothetical protein